MIFCHDNDKVCVCVCVLNYRSQEHDTNTASRLYVMNVKTTAVRVPCGME